jgi:hypothetical protein
MCQLKALEIMKEIGIQGFNTRIGWLQIFFKLNDFCIRTQTSTAQRLPNANEETVLVFQKHQYHSLGH